MRSSPTRPATWSPLPGVPVAWSRGTRHREASSEIRKGNNHDGVRRDDRLCERRVCRRSLLRRPPPHEPFIRTPGYIAVDLGPGVDLALWAGQFEYFPSDVPRTSEVCLAIDGGAEQLGEIFEDRKAKGVPILHALRDEGFGRTFLAMDPDGNRIRVAPQD